MQRQDGRWCVHKGHKGQSGPVVPGGCHDSRDKAVNHMQALYAAEGKNATRKDTRVSRHAYRSGHGFAADDQPDFSTGMMVALPIPSDLAAELAHPKGLPPDQLHVTLGYMGDSTETDVPDLTRLHADLGTIAARYLPLAGQLGGIGSFPPGPDGTPVYVPVDVPGVHRLAADVQRALHDNGLPAREDHGFTPHMTLRYHTDDTPPPDEPLPPKPVTFDRMVMEIGSDTYHYGPGASDMTTQNAAGTNLNSNGTVSSSNVPVNITIAQPEMSPTEFVRTMLASISSDPGKFAPVRLYFREGERAPDRRFIDLGAINFNRQPPWPIRLQTTQPESGGHAGAIICGVINSYADEGPVKVFDGFLDLGFESSPGTFPGRQALHLIENRTMQTWSPELGDSTAYKLDLADGSSEVHFSSATFLGASLVALPALGAAVVELLDASGNVIVPAPSRAQLVAAAQQEEQNMQTLIACARNGAPPAAWFEDPQLTELQRYVTITPEGRFFTHVAGFDECHIGFQNTCVTVDQIIAAGFDSAYHGHVLSAEGQTIHTGPITVVGGHAFEDLDASAARMYYDKPEWAVADVRYGVDSFGIWAAGAIRPTATEEQLYTLRASGVSIDAREIGGQLALVACACVNLPGFPKLKARILASGEPQDEPRVISLVAAGGRPLPDPTLLLEPRITESELASKVELLETVIREAGLLDVMFERLEASIS